MCSGRVWLALLMIYSSSTVELALRDTVAAKTREPPRVSLGAVQCGTAMTTVRSNQDN